MSLFEYLVLGTIQGITEWLPINSKGIRMLYEMYLQLQGYQVS